MKMEIQNVISLYRKYSLTYPDELKTKYGLLYTGFACEYTIIDECKFALFMLEFPECINNIYS